jgi:hypothetical protein
MCFAVLAVLIAVAVYALGVFRNHSLQQELNTGEMLKNLQDLKIEGKLSPEEYRNIKRRLSEHVLYERHGPCPDLRPAPETLLLRGVDREFVPENPDDTKMYGRDDSEDDTVKISNHH